jgi:hypothetical protein
MQEGNDDELSPVCLHTRISAVGCQGASGAWYVENVKCEIKSVIDADCLATTRFNLESLIEVWWMKWTAKR